MKNNLLKTITKQFNNLNDSQLQLLFILYQELDCHCNFFMSEEEHIKLINFYFDRILIKTTDSIKTLLYIAITQHTYKSRYNDLLKIFEMIKNNYSFNQIVNNLTTQYN